MESVVTVEQAAFVFEMCAKKKMVYETQENIFTKTEKQLLKNKTGAILNIWKTAYSYLDECNNILRNVSLVIL